MPRGRLDGLSILIVGGTSGLGLAATRACLREHASVTVVGRDDEDFPNVAAAFDASSDIADISEHVSVIAGDAMNPATAEYAVREAVTRFGGLDGVFHVAGGSGRRFGDGPLDAITDDGWRDTVDLNLTSLFHTCRAATRYLVEQERGGSILVMTSVLAFSPAPAHFATHAYAASKAGAIGLMTTCAAYYAPQGIRFNAIAPALVDTPGARRAVQNPRIAAYVEARQPLDGGRIGRPEDIDGAVVYLLSNESRFVTGQVLAVDGGWSVSDASDASDASKASEASTSSSESGSTPAPAPGPAEPQE
jgi:NAD(P)-dependent dehydrogenase (short-subunit alcohol dehydrogenase family)